MQQQTPQLINHPFLNSIQQQSPGNRQTSQIAHVRMPRASQTLQTSQSAQVAAQQRSNLINYRPQLLSQYQAYKNAMNPNVQPASPSHLTTAQVISSSSPSTMSTTAPYQNYTNLVNANVPLSSSSSQVMTSQSMPASTSSTMPSTTSSTMPTTTSSTMSNILQQYNNARANCTSNAMTGFTLTNQNNAYTFNPSCSGISITPSSSQTLQGYGPNCVSNPISQFSFLQPSSSGFSVNYTCGSQPLDLSAGTTSSTVSSSTPVICTNGVLTQFNLSPDGQNITYTCANNPTTLTPSITPSITPSYTLPTDNTNLYIGLGIGGFVGILLIGIVVLVLRQNKKPDILQKPLSKEN